MVGAAVVVVGGGGAVVVVVVVVVVVDGSSVVVVELVVVGASVVVVEVVVVGAVVVVLVVVVVVDATVVAFVVVVVAVPVHTLFTQLSAVQHLELTVHALPAAKHAVAASVDPAPDWDDFACVTLTATTPATTSRQAATPIAARKRRLERTGTLG